MTVTDSERRDIYNSLEEFIGPEQASNLMKLIPYQPAEQMVTRSDMHAQTARLQGEMAELRAELKGDMTDLRAELKGEMAELRSDFRDQFADLKISTQRLVGASMAGNTIAVVTALLM